MVFDGELSISVLPPEKLSVTLTFDHMTLNMSRVSFGPGIE